MWPPSKKSFTATRKRLGHKRDLDDAIYYGVGKDIVFNFRKANGIPAAGWNRGGLVWDVKEDEFRELHAAHQTGSAMARAAGVDLRAINYRCKKYGLKPHPTYPEFNYDDTYALMQQLGSYIRIAEYLETSRQVVRANCIRLGVRPKRQRYQSPPRQPVYRPKLLTDLECKAAYKGRTYEDSPIAARPEGRWRGISP